MNFDSPKGNNTGKIPDPVIDDNKGPLVVKQTPTNIALEKVTQSSPVNFPDDINLNRTIPLEQVNLDSPVDYSAPTIKTDTPIGYPLPQTDTIDIPVTDLPSTINEIPISSSVIDVQEVPVTFNKADDKSKPSNKIKSTSIIVGSLIIFLSLTALGATYFYKQNVSKKGEVFEGSNCACNSCGGGEWQGPDEWCKCWSTVNPGSSKEVGCKDSGGGGGGGKTCTEDKECSNGDTCSSPHCIPCSSVGGESDCWSHGVSCAWINNSCQKKSAGGGGGGTTTKVEGNCDSFTVSGGSVQLAIASCVEKKSDEASCRDTTSVGCQTETKTFEVGTHSITPPNNSCSAWQVDANGAGFTCSKVGCNWNGACSPASTPTPVPTPTPATVVCNNPCNTTTLLCPLNNTCTNNVCTLNTCLTSGAYDQTKCSDRCTPISPLTCSSLNTSITTPKRGDQVTYTCTGQGTNAGYASFRMLKGTETISSQTLVLLDTNKVAKWTVSIPISYEDGDYTVQCQICTDSTQTTQCTPWGAAK